MNDAKVKIVELDLNDILPNRFQPRIKFNEDSIVELSESIKMHGLLQPIIVRPISDKYEIVVGERRYKAAVMAELSTIPARVVDLDDKASIELALIENLQRRDLNPMEEAISYKKTLSMGYMTQEQLATKLGKSQSSIANKIRLLNLSDEVQEALMDEKISERHARSLLKVESEKNQVKLLNRIVDERLTVRKLDEIISKKEYDAKPLVTSDLELDSSSELIIDDNNEIKHENIEDSNDILNDIDDYLNSNSEKVTDISEILSFVDDYDEEDEEKIIAKDDELDVLEEDENMGNIHNLLDSEFDDGQNTVKSGSRFFNPELLNKSEENSEQSNNSGFVEKNSVIETSSTPNIFTQKYNINNLMTPQNEINSPSNNIFSLNNNSQVSEVPGQPVSTNNIIFQEQPQSSMFSNLLNGNSSGEQIDRNTLNAFLDPTYIDGEKQNNNDSSNSIDEHVFAKFIDPDFGGEIENTTGDIDLLASPSKVNNTTLVENNSNVTTSDSRPDLLAPMSPTVNSNLEKKDNGVSSFSQIINRIQPKEEKNTQPSTIGDSVIPVYSNQSELTIDDSVNKEVSSVEDEVIPKIQDTSSIPAFITSSDFSQPTAPLTPIIDKTSMDDLLKPTPLGTDNNFSDNNSYENNLISKNDFNDNFSSLDSQPIIITDYNKQYDPILPEDLTEKKPKIEFKNILNMIRDLNDKIEAYGYEIDTEEIDLQDVYQVIFNITKK